MNEDAVTEEVARPLYLPHQMMLIELEDKFGQSQVDSTWSTFLLAGALVGELQLQDRLVATGADSFAIRSEGQPLPGVLGMAEAKLKGSEMSLQKAMSNLNGFWGIGQLRQALIDELIAMGAVRLETDVFIFIPWRWRYPTRDGLIEKKVIGALKDHVDTVKGSDPPGRADLLLSLIRAAGLLETLWTPSALKRKRNLINERTKRAPLGKAVKTAVEAAQAAAAAAAIAAAT